MKDKITVDADGLQMQMKEEYLKGPHARVEIVVPQILSEEDLLSCTPTTDIEVVHTTSMSVAFLCRLLDDARDSMLKESPTIKAAYEFLKVTGKVGTVDLGEDGEIETRD